MAVVTLLATVVFCVVLFRPSNWIINISPDSPTYAANFVMLGCLLILQLFAIIGTASATRSSLTARDPLPVRPPKGLRVAFVTTRAPGEPIGMVDTTLQAIKAVRYKTGTVDVWLLDETDDQELKLICQALGVRYFSRKGIPGWNTVRPTPTKRQRLGRWLLRRQQLPVHNPYLAAKSKHGNFNAWRQHLANENIEYDILAGVDTDQVPLDNYLQRLLGYFRDPNVAYAVGPQVYGNYKPGITGLVARWAESQASFFQSTIQRAGNASTSAMFVGTNYAVRMTALDQIGGFQPCITEDMATGLAIHARRNPATGQRWKSVYTPDVLAIGEGPDYWAPYFTQQWRWAAGTFDTWRRVVWRLFFGLSPKARLHYFLILTYYPMTALTWLVAIISSMVYLLSGATAVLAPWGEFLSLYLMTVVLQMSLYFWNRRYNVSPHEPSGSYGIPGMVLSCLTAPVYLSALIGMTFGKRVNFVVTSKGGTATNPDWFSAFKIHLQWAVLLVIGLAYAISNKRDHPAMLAWVALLLAVCLTPFILGMIVAVPLRYTQWRLQHKLVLEEIPHV